MSGTVQAEWRPLSWNALPSCTTSTDTPLSSLFFLSLLARLFQDSDLLSAPVVDANNRLIGRITVDDVVDLIREDSDRTIMQMAGLDDEADMFAPVLVSSRRHDLATGETLPVRRRRCDTMYQCTANLTRFYLSFQAQVASAMGFRWQA